MRSIAKLGDKVVGIDMHIVLVPTPGGPTPVALPHPFEGRVDSATKSSVRIEHAPVAVVGSVASCTPPHAPRGGKFQKEPSHRGVLAIGSKSVFVEHCAVARDGSAALCCNDPADALTGHVVASGAVKAG